MQREATQQATASRDIPITENSDRTITVDEYETIWGVDDKKELRLKQTETFNVDSKVLAEKSEYFASMFRHRWREASSPIVLEDTPRSIEIWLRAFHESLDGIPLEAVTIEGMWLVILAADKYDFPLLELSEWFGEWFDLQKTKKQRGDYADLKENEFEKRLLYPCFRFDCASGFQALTKHLVYDVGGHIEETNPTSARQMHLPPRIIQQLNAARGRLRTMLHRQLFDQIKYIMDCDSCACKEATVYH